MINKNLRSILCSISKHATLKYYFLDYIFNTLCIFIVFAFAIRRVFVTNPHNPRTIFTLFAYFRRGRFGCLLSRRYCLFGVASSKSPVIKKNKGLAQITYLKLFFRISAKLVYLLYFPTSLIFFVYNHLLKLNKR